MIFVTKKYGSVVAIDDSNRFIGVGIDGVDDARVLEIAISRGGQVVLDGEFEAESACIGVPSSTSILGSVGTVLRGISLFINEKSHINIENLNFEGNPSYASIHIYGASSDIVIRNCIANSLGTAHYDAFLISAKAATITERIIFENCSVIDGARNGFICRGTDTYSSDTIQHVSYIRCKAIRCGKETQAQDWVIGFDPNENHPTIKYFIFQDCIADQCWESGFHQEDSANDCPVDHIKYIGCKSTRNGQKALLEARGHGFFVSGNVSLLNCSAEANYGYGIFVNEAGADVHITGCDLIACNGGINMFQSNFNPVRGQIIGNKIISMGKGIVVYNNPAGNSFINICNNFVEVLGNNECVFLAGTNHVIVGGNYLSNSDGTGYGVYIDSGSHNKILHNIIAKAGCGIYVNSESNYVSGNTVIDTGWDQAISLNAPNNIVTFNDVPQIVGSLGGGR